MPIWKPAPGYGLRVKAIRGLFEGYDSHGKPKLSQTDFSIRYLKMTQGTISNWETEDTNPGRSGLSRLALLCENPLAIAHWLETGKDRPELHRKRG